MNRAIRYCVAFPFLVAVLAFVGCGGGGPSIGVALSPSSEGIDLGQQVIITATVTNDSTNSGSTLTCSGTACPANLPPNTNAFTFTPTVTGTAQFTATSVKAPSVSKSATITVNALPTITTASLSGAIVGTAYSGGQIAVTGGTSPLSYSVSVGSLPNGLSLGSSTGAITGTPAGPASTTPVNFTVKVTDSSAAGPESSPKALSITVSQAPAVSSANKTSFVVGTSGSFTVTATGVPTPTLAEAGALPNGVTFIDNGNGTGTLSGTPASGTANNYDITFTAHNGVGTDSTQSFTLTVGLAPAITSANATSFTAGAAGTFSVTTSGFPAPALTESGALPSGVTFKDNGNGTATLGGTAVAGSGGKYPITIAASNGVGTNGSQNFTLTVDATPAITSANKVSFTVLSVGTFQVTTSGYPAPSIAESGALPSGVTFVDNGNGTGTLAGTPASGTDGSYPITFTPSNAVGSPAAQSFTLTVGQAPTVTSGNSTTFTVGSAGAFSVTTSGFPKPALTESGALPSGVTFTDNGNGTATLSGTPAAATGGTYSITITANNGVGTNATQTFTLTVDQAPAITSANSKTFSVGGAGTFTVTTTGFPNPSISESGGLPSGVTFTNNGNGTATLSGTPASGTNGSYTLNLTASNGVGTNATQTFTLTVDTAPVFTSANATTFTVGAVGSFTITASGTPAASITESGSLPSGVTFTGGTGSATLSGTPAANTGGTYTITFTASNGVGTNGTQTFTLTVDQAPGITSANDATFTEGALMSFTVTTSGFPKPSLSESGTLPSGVTFVDNGNGTATLSGTPAAGTSSSSPYSLTLTASNGVGTNGTQTFTLNVNSAPVFTSSNNTTFTVGTNGSFSFAATGNPAPTISETGTLPSGVTFTGGTGSGTLSGTPAAGTGGAYNITIKATSTSGTSTQNFTLTVDQAPVFSSSTTATFFLNVNNTFNINASGYPNNTTTITEVGSLPAGVTFTDNGNGSATLSGTPTTTTGSPWSIVFTAGNGIGTPATQSFTLTVISNPCASFSSGSESLLSGSYAFLLKGFDNGNLAGENGQTEPALVGGVLTFNGTNNSGSISAGAIDLNLDGTAGVDSLTVSSGTYQVGSDHRGCMVMNLSDGSTEHYAFSVGNISSGIASIGHMINFDTAGPFTAGILKKQDTTAFSTSKVTGKYAFGVSSPQNTNACNNGPCGGKFGAAGVFNLSAGTITGGEVDYNANGGIDNNLTAFPASPGSISSGGIYTIASDGRGTLSFLPPGNGASTVHTIIYVVSATDVLVMSSDNQTQNTIFAGELLQQSGSFSTSTLSGNYILSISSLSGSNTDVSLIRLNASSGNLTAAIQENNSGAYDSNSGSGTYTVASTGRSLWTLAGSNNNPVIYLVNANEGFFLSANGGVDYGLLESQTGGPFSASSASGTYAFGTSDPDSSAVSDSSGAAIFDGFSNITGSADDNSDGSLYIAQPISQSYTIDSTGLGLSPSGCTYNATSTTCTTIFYVVSPTKAIILDPTSSNPGLQTGDK
jgi:Putative Ig domain